ncbi:MAG TPA: ATP-binding protein [Egibacteraceae bacterium]|nr:ATP-binding protein [Egibacteraceae bacterium]
MTGQREGAGQSVRPAADLGALDLLPDAVVLIDREGRVAGCNMMAARLIGASPAALAGRLAADVCPLTDETGVDWWSCAKPLEADPGVAARIPECELRLGTLNGRLLPVTLTGSRRAGSDGRTAWLVLCLRKAERRRRLDAARSDLVSTVSHELRSPLTSVKGFTKTLLAKWERFTDDQKRQMLATVHEDADRVTRLLGELLDVSRIDAGRLRLARQMADVSAIAERVADKLAVDDDAGRVHLDFPDAVPQLYADPDKVEQIFTNLLENALKYSSGGVRVGAEVNEDAVRFTVCDEGPGIPEENVPHIFAKFFRRSGERRAGTGLGLYITKGLVEAHGGKVWYERSPGTGSEFHFTLPQGGLELAGIFLQTPPRTGARPSEDPQ